MRELEKHNPEKTEIRAVKPDERKKVRGELRPRPGQRIFELNLQTRIINEAKFSEEKIELVPEVYLLSGLPTGKLIPKKVRDIIENENCIYCAALNAKNADKTFHRMLKIKYHKK